MDIVTLALAKKYARQVGSTIQSITATDTGIHFVTSTGEFDVNLEVWTGTEDYLKLINKPLINDVELVGNKTLNELGISKVGETGNYNDLNNKPSIPTKTSELTNDKGFITSNEIPHIPTKTSELTNDSDFVTNAVDNLINYYKKTETFTQQEIQDLIRTVSGLQMQVVAQLPSDNIDTNTIYLLKVEGTNSYEQWIYSSNQWFKLGTTDVSLVDYYTKAQIDEKFVQKETDKGLSTNDFTNIDKSKLDSVETGANNYVLPIATDNILGGVKVGKNLSISTDGKLNAEVTIPQATTELGGIRANPKTELDTTEVRVDSNTGYLYCSGGGGSGTIGSISAKRYDKLPTTVINNQVALITNIEVPHYYIDTEYPTLPNVGDVFIKLDKDGKILAEQKENNGTLNVRVTKAWQYGINGWHLIDAFCGINNAWVQISKSKHPVYGFKIDKNNSDPMTRVSYTNDCIGFKPARMDFETGTFLWGSWKDFVEELATPVMLNFNGTEGYELDRNNQRKKADGTPSDITNVNYNGNAMVRLKCIWVKRWEDSNFNYINLSFERPDNGYVAYAFTNQNQIEQPQVYIPMFRGSLDSNGKLRSLADKTPWATTGGVQPEITAVNKNGSGWYTNYKSMHDLKIDLVKLITCSTDDQATLGQGNTSGNSAPLTTGTLSTFGAFYGYSDTKHQVKCFYSEVMWGDRLERMMGMCMTNSVARGKNFPPYNINGTGYSPLGDLKINETTVGYVKGMSVSSDGYFPTAYGASDNTYYCDRIYATTNSGEYYAADSSAYGNSSDCGSCFLFCYYLATHSVSNIGASLYFVAP